jgi:hypothetical protein
MDDDRSWEGRSDLSFADAAKAAVKKAEVDIQEVTEYTVELRCKGDPGHSLSEYIAVLRIPN